MNKETKLNFLWVLIPVPVILTVFSAISATMVPEWVKMLQTIGSRLILICLIVSIPIIASKIIKR